MAWAGSPDWTGATNLDWGTSTNWNTSAVPTAADTVTIDGGSGSATISSMNAAAGSLSVGVAGTTAKLDVIKGAG